MRLHLLTVSALLTASAVVAAAAGCRRAQPRATTEFDASVELQAHASAAAPYNFATPSYGNGATLYVDSCKVTSCSSGGTISDNNDCSQTCTGPGVGPCAHAYVIGNKWGRWKPTITANTGVTFLSNCLCEHVPIAAYSLNDAGLTVTYPSDSGCGP